MLLINQQKTMPKLLPMLLPKSLSMRHGFASGPPRPDLITYLKGYNDDGLSFKQSGRTSKADAVRGTVLRGDGSGSGAADILTTDTITAGSVGVPTCAVDGTVTFADSTDYWDVKVYRSGVLIADWHMINKGETTEFDWSGNDNHLVLSSFAGDAIVEVSDGTGSDRVNVDGYGLDGDGIRYPLNHASATTNYPGPLSRSALISTKACITGDGSGYATITGLLTTDTITSLSTSVPTCTTNGRMDFASGEDYSGITVTRGGETWAHYPCENGHPTLYPDTAWLQDVVDGNHAVLTGFTGDPYGTCEVWTDQEVDGGYVSSVELVTDGDCEDALPTMNGEAIATGSTSRAISTDQSHSGDSSIIVTKINSTPSAYTTFSDPIACGVAIGSTYQKSVWVYLPSGQTVDTLLLQWRKSDYSYVTLDSTTETDKWVELEGVFTSDGARHILRIAALNDTVSGEYWYVDDLSVRQILPASFSNPSYYAVHGGSADWVDTSDNLIDGVLPSAVTDITDNGDGTYTYTRVSSDRSLPFLDVTVIGDRYQHNYEIVSSNYTGRIDIVGADPDETIDSNIGIHTHNQETASEYTTLYYRFIGGTSGQSITIRPTSLYKIYPGLTLATNGIMPDDSAADYRPGKGELLANYPGTSYFRDPLMMALEEFTDEAEFMPSALEGYDDTYQWFIGLKGFTAYSTSQEINVTKIDRVLDLFDVS